MKIRKWTAWIAAIVMLCAPLEEAACAAARAEEEPLLMQTESSQSEAEEKVPEVPKEEQPTEPETEQPIAPETEQPTAPETEQPIAPETEQPTAPETEQPTAPETEQPTAPETEQPTAPETEQPTAPETEQPTAPETDQPTAPETEQPIAPETETVPETDEEKAFVPQGEAWAKLADGELLDGKLQDVLDEISFSGKNADVYLMTEEEIRLENTSERIFERVKLHPDPETFTEPDKDYQVVWRVETGEAKGLPPIFVQVVDKNTWQPPEPETPPTEPETTPSEPETPPTEPETTPTDPETPTPENTPEPEKPVVPDNKLVVEVEGLVPDAWSNIMPTFKLSGIAGNEYVYGVFVCDERLILLSDGNNVYSPTEQGEIKLRFAILDKMGDVVSLSDEYDMLLDMTPPDGPYLSGDDECDTICWVDGNDYESGLKEFSLDAGETWIAYEPEMEISFVGEKGETVEPETVLLRDNAGNVSSNMEEFTFGKRRPSGVPGAGQDGGKKPIKHVKETLDYSKVNYNALELSFSDEPTAELKMGDERLNLSLTRGTDETPCLFTAKMDVWKRTERDKRKTGNALVLTAYEGEPAAEQEKLTDKTEDKAQKKVQTKAKNTAEKLDQETNVWHFGGDVYKLLYNSGIDYLVFQSGEYIAAIPTAGFTGGTQYSKLKAKGVSTRKFEYTVSQDEALRETAMTVTVEDETYLLGEDRAQPMYRYDVLVGPSDMMKKPYESYMPVRQ